MHESYSCRVWARTTGIIRPNAVSAPEFTSVRNSCFSRLSAFVNRSRCPYEQVRIRSYCFELGFLVRIKENDLSISEPELSTHSIFVLFQHVSLSSRLDSFWLEMQAGDWNLRLTPFATICRRRSRNRRRRRTRRTRRRKSETHVELQVLDCLTVLVMNMLLALSVETLNRNFSGSSWSAERLLL